MLKKSKKVSKRVFLEKIADGLEGLLIKDDHISLNKIQHMVRGPLYFELINSLYDDVFRKHLKYGTTIYDDKENIELTSEEIKIIEKIKDKVMEHFKDAFRVENVEPLTYNSYDNEED